MSDSYYENMRGRSREIAGQVRERIGSSNIDTGRAAEMAKGYALPLSLLGVGAGWLLYSRMRESGAGSSEPHRGMSRGPSGAAGQYGRESGYGGDYGYGEETQYSGGYPAAGPTPAGAEYEDWANEYGDGQGRGGGRGGRISQKVSEVGRRLSSAGGQMREKVGHWRQSGGGGNMNYSEYVDRSKEAFRQNPMVIGALALIAGAAIGAMLPRSRVENTWMGSMSDEIARRARAAGRNTWQQATDVAEETAQAARGEAEGLMGHARESAEHIRDKARSEVEKKDWTDVDPSSRPH